MPADNQTAPDGIQFNLATVDRGTVATVRRDGRSASYLTTTALSKHPKFGPAINAFDGALAAALDRIATLNADGYTGAALDREVESQLSRLRPVMLAAISEIRKIRGEHQARKARTLEFPREANAPLRSDLRNWWLSHEAPQRIGLALNGNWMLLSALIEAGQEFSDLSPELWNQIEMRFMALNHVKVAGLDASNVIPSTTEFLTGAGPDHAAAFALAMQAVKAWEAEIDLLNLAESYFQAALQALMLVSGKSAIEITGLPV